MPRKKKETTEAPQIELKEPAVLEGPEQLYVIGQWRGHPHYQCAKCRFDTLSQEEIEGHVAYHKADILKPSQPVDSVQDPEQTGDADMFELELEEVRSFTDEDGTEHKKFTVKE